jgi:hypothetical protein
MGSTECRPDTGGALTKQDKQYTYDFDKIAPDLKDPDHKAICLSQKNNEDILFQSKERGPFNLIVTPASKSATQCAVDQVLIRDDNGGDCVDNATLKLKEPDRPKDCLYEIFPLFGCKPGTMGGTPGADPHVKTN